MVYADYSDVPSDAIYKEAVDRLSAFGIISGDAGGMFHPSDILTRAEFAKIAVSAAGLQKQALSKAGVSLYSDVQPWHWASGYINMAAEQGFLTGFGNGNFRPDDQITYAQVITVLLKMLGYTNENLGGIWPYNFIEQAKALNITDGIQFQSTDVVPRGIAALLLDRTLFEEVVSSSGSTSSGSASSGNTSSGSTSSGSAPTGRNTSKITLLEKSGLGTIQECIITATHGTDSSVSLGRVKTDINEYTTSIGSLDEYIGKKVKIILNEENKIVGIIEKEQSLERIMVKSVAGNEISVLGSLIITLPENIPMYYHGEKGTFSSNKQNISLGSVIILSGAFKGSYDYAILLDPELEGPITVTRDVQKDDEYIQNIDICNKENIQVIRNGENALLTDIKAYDILYVLKNPPDNIQRLFVYDKKITGVYEEALPSKAFVNKIIVSGQEIEVETQKAVSKLDESPGAYKIDDRITVLTGRNGKAVDVVDINASDVSNFAVVINARQDVSVKEEEKGKREYYVTLFKTDGTTQEYKADKEYERYKGELVTFDFVNGYVSLKRVAYSPISGEINRVDGMIGDYWLAKEPVIFDLINNPANGDAVVKKVKLSDLLSLKRLWTSDVIHAERRNAFGDIQLLYLNNATYSTYQYGIVTDIDDSSNDRVIRCSYTLDIKGKEYKFNNLNVKFPVGERQPVAVDTNGNSINRMVPLIKIETSGKVEAYDQERIKVDGKIYKLGEEVQVYKKQNVFNMVPVSLNELTADKSQRVTLYTERSPESGGKIRIIVIQ